MDKIYNVLLDNFESFHLLKGKGEYIYCIQCLLVIFSFIKREEKIFTLVSLKIHGFQKLNNSPKICLLHNRNPTLMDQFGVDFITIASV